jgi:hypothetical protein
MRPADLSHLPGTIGHPRVLNGMGQKQRLAFLG